MMRVARRGLQLGRLQRAQPGQRAERQHPRLWVGIGQRRPGRGDVARVTGAGDLLPSGGTRLSGHGRHFFSISVTRMTSVAVPNPISVATTAPTQMASPDMASTDHTRWYHRGGR